MKMLLIGTNMNPTI